MSDIITLGAMKGELAKQDPQFRQAISQAWPGITIDTGLELARITRGMPLQNPNRYKVVQRRFFHRQDYATGGHTSLTFFANTAPSDFVCNLQSTGTVGQDQPFVCTSLAVTMEHVTTAGARVAGAASSASGATTALARAEEVATIFQAADLQFFINSREEFRTHDLHNFPAGGGPDMSGATGLTTGAMAHYNNGVPAFTNLNVLRYPVVVLPGQGIRVNLLWAQALSLTASSAIRVELIGEQLTQYQN